MIKRKSTLKYYFSVEGETEQWYLEWLQDQINNAPEAGSKVSFNKQIQKDPLKRAKSLAITDKVEIWHLSDYESSEEAHAKQFKETMDRMADIKKRLKKQINYKFGYSNLTFDLWIILHIRWIAVHLFHTESNTLRQSIKPMTKALRTWMSSSRKRILRGV